MTKNINDYINGQRALRTLEHKRAAARQQYDDIIDYLCGNTEYDDKIRTLAAELDEFASSHRTDIDELYRQYGAHQNDDGYYYVTDEYKREIPFSLVRAICGEEW